VRKEKGERRKEKGERRKEKGVHLLSPSSGYCVPGGFA
jgi:hypothetical protein